MTMRLKEFSVTQLCVVVFLLFVSSSAESSSTERLPSVAQGRNEGQYLNLSSAPDKINDTNFLVNEFDVEKSQIQNKEPADLHYNSEGVLHYYQPQLRANQHRRLPGGFDAMDFDSPEAQSAVILLVIVLLVCCCWGGRRGGCSLCDILACVCIYEMCCDNGAPMNDFMSF